MLGNQRLLRLYDGNSTTLVQALAATDDTIYVDDASKLTLPNPSQNIFGAVIINANNGAILAKGVNTTFNNSIFML